MQETLIEFATNRRDECARMASEAANRGDYDAENHLNSDCRYWVGYLDGANEMKKEMERNADA